MCEFLCDRQTPVKDDVEIVSTRCVCIGLNLSVWLYFFKTEKHKHLFETYRGAGRDFVPPALKWTPTNRDPSVKLQLNVTWHSELRKVFFPVSVQDLGRRSNDNLISSLRSSGECFCSSLSLKIRLLLMIIGKKVTHV